jgi:hypothetical protein
MFYKFFLTAGGSFSCTTNMANITMILGCYCLCLGHGEVEFMFRDRNFYSILYVILALEDFF